MNYSYFSYFKKIKKNKKKIMNKKTHFVGMKCVFSFNNFFLV